MMAILKLSLLELAVLQLALDLASVVQMDRHGRDCSHWSGKVSRELDSSGFNRSLEGWHHHLFWLSFFAFDAFSGDFVEV